MDNFPSKSKWVIENHFDISYEMIFLRLFTDFLLIMVVQSVLKSSNSGLLWSTHGC